MATNKTKRARDLRRQQDRKRRAAAEDAPAKASMPQRSGPSPSRQSPAVEGREVARKLDRHHGLRMKLAEVAEAKGEWAGLPMPLEGERLVVHPNYPWAAALSKIGANADDEDQERVRVRNVFWSTWRRCEVAVFEEDGRVTKAYLPGSFNNLDKQLRTMGCSDAWGVEQEGAAIQTLGTLVQHRQLKQYLLTGSFLETSRRSGLVYMFRRLRPTVVIENNFAKNTTSVRCTLCLHPIAHYADAWAGAMCPTDDVVAALMLMRGDEPMLWRRANQHPPHRPEAGL